jgi:hypothetical protein
MISTRDLSGLPTIENLKTLTQSLSLLDAIVQRNRAYRYYFFDSRWGIEEQLASMDNGQGDSWVCVFAKAGALLKGFDHEAPMSPWNNKDHTVWPGILDDVPHTFQPIITEPALSSGDTTFCIWRAKHNTQWHRGRISFPPSDDPDGSAHLLSILDGNPRTYQQWAEEYYERPISVASVEHIYAHRTLTAAIVHDLNPDTSLSALADDISEIGYPIG